MHAIKTCVDHTSSVRVSDIAIMPDHVHFIVSIQPSHSVRYNFAKGALWKSPTSGSLGSIIRTIKSVSTRSIRKENISFAWHRNYYERIIRDDISLSRIKRYIAMNPKRWEERARNQTDSEIQKNVRA